MPSPRGSGPLRNIDRRAGQVRAHHVAFSRSRIPVRPHQPLLVLHRPHRRAHFERLVKHRLMRPRQVCQEPRRPRPAIAVILLKIRIHRQRARHRHGTSSLSAMRAARSLRPQSAPAPPHPAARSAAPVTPATRVEALASARRNHQRSLLCLSLGPRARRLGRRRQVPIVASSAAETLLADALPSGALAPSTAVMAGAIRATGAFRHLQFLSKRAPIPRRRSRQMPDP